MSLSKKSSARMTCYRNARLITQNSSNTSAIPTYCQNYLIILSPMNKSTIRSNSSMQTHLLRLRILTRARYSYVSCEVLSCEIWSICETVVQSRELLSNFWTFLDRPPPLNPLQASYFTKVNEQFLEKKTDEVSFLLNQATNIFFQMIPFIQSIPNIVPKLLRHIETSAIMDLLLKIISMEKSEPGSGIVGVIVSRRHRANC
jgi:SIT4 phosphatase-associated protein